MPGSSITVGTETSPKLLEMSDGTTLTITPDEESTVTINGAIVVTTYYKPIFLDDDGIPYFDPDLMNTPELDLIGIDEDGIPYLAIGV